MKHTTDLSIFSKILFSLLFVFAAIPAFADNITISDYFPEGGPAMDASPVSCGQFITQPYMEAGSVSVSSNGNYEIADAGNLLGFTGIGQGVSDIVINIYDGNFDPLDTTLNRVSSVDEGNSVPLQTGINYLLVIQPFCEYAGGTFGIVIRGDGNVTGAGFATATHTSGQHENGDSSANFPLEIGTHVYDASAPIAVSRTGLYYFGEVGANFNAGITLLAYEGSFNPGNTSTNLIGSVSTAGSLSLSRDKVYVFVAVDQSDLQGNWQYTLFPPGDARFNESMKGAWVTPGVDGSGIMLEVGTQSGVLFFAWFTFPEAPIVASSSKIGVTPNNVSGTTLDAAVGSTDQRWLTGFGPVHSESSVVDIKYENTTGGVFNSTTPKPTTDSNYGFGMAEVFDCNNISVSYDLPDGLQGSADMIRALSDGTADCLKMVDAGPITPTP